MTQWLRARTLVSALILGQCALAGAVGVDAITSTEAASGLKAALSQGVDKAVAQLGANGGFLNNPKVTIPLPSTFEKVDNALRMVGMSGDADALKATMNHAAEQAMTSATPVLKKALRSMTLTDAKSVLTGSDDAATSYFRRASGDELKATFKPIVARATARVKLATVYNQYASKAAELGLMSATDANMNDYVTGKALDGLFIVIADEERAIRKDPLGQASSLIKKVFSSL